MPSSSRCLEHEFEEEQKISNLKRLRGKESLKQLESGKSDCETCCDEFCGCSFCSCWLSQLILAVFSFEHKCISIIIYTIFPLFIVLDFLIGSLAKSQGWYSASLGQMVCHWSATACAIWIAVALSATLVAAFSFLGKLTNFLCDSCHKQGKLKRLNLKNGPSGQQAPEITVTSESTEDVDEGNDHVDEDYDFWQSRRGARYYASRPSSTVVVVV
ncbi:uncharacterized protein LOC131884496 [Tigriopus californicus]|uniref:uncharacterized protein LOC131884496 n=1 Tax=Tigriopus californicus TaxID=6832 RepID=UPI0027D9F9DF|nr:uncharacterized protein LOC131884496 [Tigriopus californicus]